MKVYTPQISWHNRLPALALDISGPLNGDVYRIATGGNDCRVYIWMIDLKNGPDVRIRAGLRRHQKSIGAVRFYQSTTLATGDDDGYIYIWNYKEDQEAQGTTDQFIDGDEVDDLEVWQQHRVLRGHIEDICDLAWSKDGQHLLSGSVDNSAILWDAAKGTKVWCSDLIKGYVQGVALDPYSELMATISSDRTLRIYNFSDKRLLHATRRMNIKGRYKAYFRDDQLQTFCRRLEFSPDGQFLIVPTSRMFEIESRQEATESTEKLGKPFDAFLLFERSSFNQPVHYYKTGREPALCVRFSPVIYELMENNSNNFWEVPYRMVFAVATSRSVIIYDSQHHYPIGYISNIHLARLTDLSWSSDGKLLTVTSYDGYITMVTFDNDEFGEKYTGPSNGSIKRFKNQKGTPVRKPEPSNILKYVVRK